MQSVFWWLLFAFPVCTANFSPPLVSINLDQAPELRWSPLKDVFSKDFLQKAAAEVIDATIPGWINHVIKPIARVLAWFTPQPYASEITGIAACFGIDIADALLLNFAYEVSPLCSSILAQDTKGQIYHARNMDYPHKVLKNVTIDVLFSKNGEVAYRGTTFAGYVGLWTGQSKNNFTVSGNQRSEGNWWGNIISTFLLRNSPVSWLVRETLEKAPDYRSAVMQLSNVPIIAKVYYIVGGVHPGEGVVITRDRSGPADIWPLDTLNGNWYRVQTNYDHWLPAPKRDNRRGAAMKALDDAGQDNINLSSLYQV
ncbi:N-acylsphingosine amidohydrolase 1 precursor, partial [Silurus meridionalis]